MLIVASVAVIRALGVRIFVAMSVRGMRVEPRLAVEDEEVHAERIERRDEHAEQHRVVGKGRTDLPCLMRRMRGDDDAVLRVEAGEERRADERQRTDQRRYP